MTFYVTDNMAKNGVINLSHIEVDGRRKSPFDDTNIGVLINAPNSHVVISRIVARNVWKGFEFRYAKSITVGSILVKDFGNDAGHVCCSHVDIKKLYAQSDIQKTYSNKNHPDLIQIFAYVQGVPLSNIRVRYIRANITGCDKHGVIHLTENNKYDRVFIGEDGLSLYVDAELYPYWFSSTNLSNSIVGHPRLKVHGRTARVKDVKHSGIKTYNNIFVGVEKEDIELTDPSKNKFYAQFPKTELERLLDNSVRETADSERIHLRKEDEILARLAEAKLRALGL